jgi:dTDP-4-amino-4,6-dideoxygalactose transaminase
MILCGNPAASYRAHRTEIDAAVSRVFESERYILGAEVSSFEQDFSAYLGVPHAVGTGNATDALYLALRACGIGSGDEVITVAHTASATAAAIVMSGATPVFADIDPVFYTLDPAQLPALLTERTKAVIPVHLYGQPAELDPILSFAKNNNLRVIEDCAQSTGAEYKGRKTGSMGDIGCFSFYPTKNLGAYGDGGMAVTRDAALAEKLRRLRQYGWDDSPVSMEAGVNSRLDELQAAILNAKLPHLDSDNAKRIEIADRYDQALADSGLTLPLRRAGSAHVFHLYVVRSRRRDALMEHLRANGIFALAHYPVPAHLQPAYAAFAPPPGTLVATERAAREVISLPVYPELTSGEQQQVIEAVHAFGEIHRGIH